MQPLVAAPVRGPWNDASALQVMLCGVPGFFTPRIPPAPLQPRGTLEAISYYDTRPLQATLERLVDFDRINSGATRLSVGAVNVRTGNFAYFDSAKLSPFVPSPESFGESATHGDTWTQTLFSFFSGAELSVEESAAGLIALSDRLTLADSGRFWQWDGTELAW